MCNYFIYNLVVKLIDSFMIRIHVVTFYLCTFGFFVQRLITQTVVCRYETLQAMMYLRISNLYDVS